MSHGTPGQDGAMRQPLFAREPSGELSRGHSLAACEPQRGDLADHD
jgi:hypothetical protein